MTARTEPTIVELQAEIARRLKVRKELLCRAKLQLQSAIPILEGTQSRWIEDTERLLDLIDVETA